MAVASNGSGPRPLVDDGDLTIHVGDVRDVLPTIEAESVDCVATSPPFYALRDYGVDGQIGLEASPDEWCQALVDVFGECRRVLKPSGTLWIECGDSYNANVGAGFNGNARIGQQDTRRATGLKPKDLLGQPWLLAFALRADGWSFRQCIIWSKTNAMPESVTDRCTTAHSYVFVFAKCRRSGPEPSLFENIPESDKRYLAALIDTEGCISMKRVRSGNDWADSYGAQVAIANQSTELLEYGRSLLGGVGNLSLTQGTNAPVHHWQIHNKVARELLLAVYPYLIVKKRQARIAIYAETLTRVRGGREGFGKGRAPRSDATNAVLERCWLAVKACNKRETPDLSWVPEPKYGKWMPQTYFFDGDAIAEPAAWERWGDQTVPKYEGTDTSSGWMQPRSKHELVALGNGQKPRTDERRGFDNRLERVDGMKHPRSVWTIPTRGYSGAHFATWPEALAERIIKAGCPEGGTVLDPFLGAGTTALVARRLGRSCVGVELNPEYARLAAGRCSQLSLLADAR